MISTYKITKTGTIVIPGDSITTENISVLKQVLDEVYSQKPEGIIFDFTNVTEIDSAGLSILIANYKKCVAIRMNVVFCSLNQQILDLFYSMHLDKVYKIFKDQQGAFDYLNQSG